MVPMQLHGTLSENLRAALSSIKRLRGCAVHPDTIDYWERLLAHARDQVRKGSAGLEAAELIRHISLELLDREPVSGVISR